MCVPRLTVTQRTRHQLNRLLKMPGYSKTDLANHCGKPGSWLSAFLHPDPKRSANPSFHLDELDDIAEYFRISLGELLGAPKAGDLTGDEARLLLAFRAVPPAVQDHFLALIETASIAPRAQKGLPSRRKADVNSVLAAGDHARSLPDAHDELARLRAAIQRALVDLGTAALGTAAASTGHDRQDAAIDAGQATRRGVAGRVQS